MRVAVLRLELRVVRLEGELRRIATACHGVLLSETADTASTTLQRSRPVVIELSDDSDEGSDELPPKKKGSDEPLLIELSDDSDSDAES